MPLKEKNNLREKILLLGPAGAGKTTAHLSIAWWAFQSGDTRRFWVLDTDDEAVLQVMDEPKYEGMLASVNGDVIDPNGNVHIFDGSTWKKVEAFRDYVMKEVRRGDWVVFDFITQLWTEAQEGFLQDAWEKSRGEVLYDQGVKGLSGWEMFSEEFNWNCASEDTEIFTRSGWKTYDQLTPFEDVLVLSSDGTSRWEPLLGLNISPQVKTSMVHMYTRIHDSLTTPNHRWPLPDNKWVTSDSITPDHRILACAPHRNENLLPKYEDAFVELAAWYWCEGHKAQTKGGRSDCRIFQSLKNEDNCNRIRNAMNTVFADRWKETKHQGVQLFRLGLGASEEVFAIFEDTKEKNPRYDFLSSLTHSQLLLFIDTCIRGDGTINKGRRIWYQKSEESIRRFEFACVLAGLGVRTKLYDNKHPSHFGGPIWITTILSQTASRPAMAVRMHRYNSTPTERQLKQRGKVEEVSYQGIVWCPTTSSGTWLARRNGTVYFTGNSINGSYFSVLKDLTIKSGAHIFQVAEEEVLDPDARKKTEDQKEHLAQFGKYKAKGQKRLPYACRSYLRTVRLARGRVLQTNGKDRARKEFDGDVISPDFCKMYLVGAAGWTIDDE